jgi:hypothetical protein
VIVTHPGDEIGLIRFDSLGFGWICFYRGDAEARRKTGMATKKRKMHKKGKGFLATD